MLSFAKQQPSLFWFATLNCVVYLTAFFPLKRELETALKLGAAKHQLDKTELVLDRIDAVAEVLLSGDSQQDSIQRKFQLKSSPKLNGKTIKKVFIEQAYLPGGKTREDRIRRLQDEVRSSEVCPCGIF